MYPYRIAERKPNPVLWNFDKEALDEIARNFRSRSVFNVDVKEKALVLRIIEEPVS